jgi:hypothetical protein
MSDPIDDMPIGSVLASAVAVPPNSNYLVCDGALLQTANYPELATALANIYDPNPPAGQFRLPDYRGIFLRGARDKQPLGTYQDYGTGRPTNQFKGKVSHLPNSTVGSHGETSGGKARVGGDATINTCTNGGDGDTRPVNIYVQYFIKAKDGGVA